MGRSRIAAPIAITKAQGVRRLIVVVEGGK